MKKKIALLIMLCTIFQGPLLSIKANTIKEMENEVSDMQKEYDKNLDAIANEENEFSNIKQQIEDVLEQQTVIENKITTTNNEINKKQLEIQDLKENKIPATEAKAQVSLKFAQENMNNNIMLYLLNSQQIEKNQMEVVYATNKILTQLNNNLFELGDLIKKAEEDEAALEQSQLELTYQQEELVVQKEYLKNLQAEISYKISALEQEANDRKDELAAEQEKIRIYAEAGCGPDDVYGVDCARDEIPESDSGFIRPLAHGLVTNEYGGWNAILGAGQHSGIDLAADEGYPVNPTAPGKVLYSGWTGDGGGYSVILIHVMNGQNYISRYAHLSEVDVNTGDIVYASDTIGLVGSTGSAFGPHLHFEIQQNNMYVWGTLENPRNYINFPEFGTAW